MIKWIINCKILRLHQWALIPVEVQDKKILRYEVICKRCNEKCKDLRVIIALIELNNKIRAGIICPIVG